MGRDASFHGRGGILSLTSFQTAVCTRKTQLITVAHSLAHSLAHLALQQLSACSVAPPLTLFASSAPSLSRLAARPDNTPPSKGRNKGQRWNSVGKNIAARACFLF